MMTLLALLTAVLAVHLGVAPPAGRRWHRRLEARAAADGPSRVLRAARRGGVVLAGVAVVGLGGWVAGARGSVVALAGVIVTGTVAQLVGGRLRESSSVRSQTEVARACARLASQLEVGQVPSAALAAAARDSPVLEEAYRVQQLGGDVTRVWAAQAVHPGQEGLRQLARAWRVAVDTGAPMSATLAQVAAGLGADQDLRAVVAGELASPRATGKVMAALPACGVGLGYLLGGDPIGWLVGGPFGWACLLGGVLLACAGVSWVERLGRRAAG